MPGSEAVMQLDPGDVTVAQIEAVFFGIEEVRAMALDGYGADEIAQANGWRLEDVRHAAELMGFTVSEMVQHVVLCPKCGHPVQPDGHCMVCALRVRLERLSAVNAEERRREVVWKLEREINAMKSDTRHVRKRMGTSPRTKREQ